MPMDDEQMVKRCKLEPTGGVIEPRRPSDDQEQRHTRRDAPVEKKRPLLPLSTRLLISFLHLLCPAFTILAAIVVALSLQRRAKGRATPPSSPGSAGRPGSSRSISPPFGRGFSFDLSASSALDQRQTHGHMQKLAALHMLSSRTSTLCPSTALTTTCDGPNG